MAGHVTASVRSLIDENSPWITLVDNTSLFIRKLQRNFKTYLVILAGVVSLTHCLAQRGGQVEGGQVVASSRGGCKGPSLYVHLKTPNRSKNACQDDPY
ncbi:hypothetical protein E2C01_040772 [Portunus trituberculatus]|uniref:Uncharacterized protein n=1 Tax=Portunus trituberculatus TaxID=210409 RepID=A0A5B7FQ41_PORTR|nr:hypothetical protein [Portunus trituberculatus]